MPELTLEKLREVQGMLQELPNRDFYVVVHPRTAYSLRVLEARDRYKEESHKRRWEKRNA